MTRADGLSNGDRAVGGSCAFAIFGLLASTSLRLDQTRPVQPWVQTRSSPKAGASRRGRGVSRGRPHFRDVYGVFVPTVARPGGTRRPRNTNRGRPTHSNTRVTGGPSSSSGIIKGLLGSLPVGAPVASDLNPRVRGCSPRRTAFDGESGQPTIARLPQAR